MFDPKALTATATDESLAGTSNADPYKRLEGTPFRADLRASFDRGKASQYIVTKPEDADKLVGYLRLAARAEDLGVRIPTPYGRTKEGKILVKFQGKKRAQHKTDTRLPRRHKGEPDGEWNARVSEWEAKSGLKYAERRAELDAIKAKNAKAKGK